MSRRGKPFTLGLDPRRNAGGRPKAHAEIVELARAKSARAIERLGEILESSDERAAMAAASALLDRAWGRSAQAVAVGAAAAMPTEVNLAGLREELLRKIQGISTAPTADGGIRAAG